MKKTESTRVEIRNLLKFLRYECWRFPPAGLTRHNNGNFVRSKVSKDVIHDDEDSFHSRSRMRHVRRAGGDQLLCPIYCLRSQQNHRILRDANLRWSGDLLI